MPVKKVLILGGTREAAELARELHESCEWEVTTSLAGRTKEPAPLAGNVRVGGFGGADGLAKFIRENGYSHVIDATHPFAKTISENAIKACRSVGIGLEIRMRRPWEPQDGDNWTVVDSLEEAANSLPVGARVFLALGRQYLDAFKSRTDCEFIIRMVDEPTAPLGFTHYQVIVAKPQKTPQDEASLFRQCKITHLVCRNSGGEGAYAKIAAARELGLPLLMLSRS